MRTLQLLDDVETLIELREDVGNGTREQDVLRGFLKLKTLPTVPEIMSTFIRQKAETQQNYTCTPHTRTHTHCKNSKIH